MTSTAASQPADLSFLGFGNLQFAPLSWIQCQTGVKDFSRPRKIWPKGNAKTPGEASVFVEEMNRTSLQVQLVTYRVNKSGEPWNSNAIKTIDIPSDDYRVSVITYRVEREGGVQGLKYEFVLTPNDDGVCDLEIRMLLC